MSLEVRKMTSLEEGSNNPSLESPKYANEIHQLLSLKVPPEFSVIFQMYKLLYDLTEDSIDQVVEFLDKEFKPQYYREFFKILTEFTRINARYTKLANKLLTILRTRIANLTKYIYYYVDSYSLMQYIYKAGDYQAEDLKRLVKRHDRFTCFFPDLFEYIEDDPHYCAYYKCALNVIQAGIEDRKWADIYPPNCIQYSIYHDDPSTLKKYLTKKKFKINGKIFHSPIEWFANRPLERPETWRLTRTPLELSAYYGSIKSFRLIKDKGGIIDKNVVLAAIAGKNNDIIEICDETNDFPDIEEIVIHAVKYHNPRFYVLANEIEITENLLERCLLHSNYEAYFYFKSIKDINVSYQYLAWKGFYSLLRPLFDQNLDLDYFRIFKFFVLKGEFEILLEIIEIHKDIDFMKRDEDGLYLIHYAAMSHNTKIIDLLIKNGLDVNLKSEIGMTAVQFAIEVNDLEMFNYLVDVLHADVHIVDELGNTCLHSAAFSSDPEITDRLLAMDLKSNVKNKDGKTPIENIKDKDKFADAKEYYSKYENIFLK
ncbi:hypothetical protein TVAG_221950 [Trichomonas vaginalis G3]|uniref:Uncharacterized protein n=1 Tax=Trichomonas vaginalis (strain ATCC PRA-98 / G3) TaxID=412133 RepID=A2E3F0_TRIV3|nr:protein ubiquitination [Trichomonas vaginalis G3]EAY12841.1 hypothetical protein TVAG_221950 [Trichomonas vaginalis G3]KAI5488502.1 protein ubiquitination [Trichomonas vaginalis G3]|eukprot:XP_001325064.1 hypothetical protein [Trichomonas vaginalis G3]